MLVLLHHLAVAVVAVMVAEQLVVTESLPAVHLEPVVPPIQIQAVVLVQLMQRAVVLELEAQAVLTLVVPAVVVEVVGTVVVRVAPTGHLAAVADHRISVR
jgi:hypothetical protein